MSIILIFTIYVEIGEIVLTCSVVIRPARSSLVFLALASFAGCFLFLFSCRFLYCCYFDSR